jgi:hypothetical protein
MVSALPGVCLASSRLAESRAQTRAQIPAADLHVHTLERSPITAPGRWPLPCVRLHLGHRWEAPAEPGPLNSVARQSGSQVARRPRTGLVRQEVLASVRHALVPVLVVIGLPPLRLTLPGRVGAGRPLRAAGRPESDRARRRGAPPP